ncbi:hypothetical protein YBT1520_01825 [Bacillus thuringiensis serovar kurstaki str. YBT-1520]|nr:hypothetical protein YBT1520_01825 [Bacillus thuringiensis serovar kurstaki str. YBT-1520]AIE31464.1 hypothetical protein BTK_01670 [Bacillus thuringiensis serovar kurstaki str. HD-1]
MKKIVMKGKQMCKLKEYDLAYICYYSERIEFSAIAAGFSQPVSTKVIHHIVQELNNQGLFDFYKSTYEEMLEE